MNVLYLFPGCAIGWRRGIQPSFRQSISIQGKRPVKASLDVINSEANQLMPLFARTMTFLSCGIWTKEKELCPQMPFFR